MEKPLVSIIIPTYNRLESLRLALKSVFEQSFENYEVIVVDDGSTDGTREYFEAQALDYRIQYYFKDNEGHPAFSRNYGAHLSNGKYLAFLDSDDEWHPSKLFVQVDRLERQENLAFSFTQASTKNGVLISRYFPRKTGNILFPLLMRNFVVTSSVVVRKDAFDLVGGFPTAPNLVIAEDLMLWLKLSLVGDGDYIDEVLVYYDLGDGISSNVIKKFDCLLEVTNWGLQEVKASPLARSLVLLFYWIRRYLQCRESELYLEDFRVKFKQESDNFILKVFLKFFSIYE